MPSVTLDETNYTQSVGEGEKPYFLSRAQWHEHRAQMATDDSTRSIHLRFAKLYHARALS
ncbi:hypothetical protein C8J46_10840 [Sphingomonas sp. PP-F2F-A104-K0414]|nr:hypothetical protein C8J46_10840 [Sphingomonas sp. PP-F2F-A104-K0414]